MSVSSTTNQVIYTGSGTTGPFDFTFKIFVNTDLVITKYTIADGTTTTLTLTTDYTVTIDGENGGEVNLVSALSSAYKLIITRTLPLTQSVNYVENDPFPADTHEEALDRAAMRDQQLQEQIDRAVLVTAGSGTDPNDLIDSVIASAATATAAAATASTASDAAVAAAASTTFFWGGTSGGAADAQTLTPSPAITSYSTGYRFAFKAGFTNTGACTINVSGLGAKSLVSQGGAALIAGQIITGNVYMIAYDGTNFYVDEIITSANAISGASLYSLPNIPAGAGVIPSANLPAAAVTKFKMISTTKDISTTGAVATTGAGFTPKGLIVFGAINGGTVGVWGMTTSVATHYGIYKASGSTTISDTVSFVYVDMGGGAVASAVLTSFDADGFTLTWSKTGSPTGTITLVFMCLG